MRRLLSLVLLAAFGLPAVAPALALGQDTEKSLPACCRRNGAHHCMGNMRRTPNSAPAVSERCTRFPQPSITPSAISSFAILSSMREAIAHQTSLLTQQPTAELRPSTHDFALYKRGPPSQLL